MTRSGKRCSDLSKNVQFVTTGASRNTTDRTQSQMGKVNKELIKATL